VSEHVLSKTDTLAPSAVAVALVLLRSDGTIDTSAIGLEPEYLPFIVRGLKGLTTRLSNPTLAKRGGITGQRGAAAISIASALAFGAATYINEYAWLDAALTLAAQIFAAHFWGRPHKG
jgi:hypothetical protein